MKDLTKLAAIGAGAGIGALLLPKLIKAQPQPPEQPPEPEPKRKLAPITNPSFEQGLQGWETIRYGPHPSKVGNGKNHLVQTTSEHATRGQKAMHLLVHKTTEDSKYLRNVSAKAWQEIDTTAIDNKYNKLLIDAYAKLNFDAVKSDWGAYYAGAIIQIGSQKWAKRFKGEFNETIEFNISEFPSPGATIQIQTVIWDQEPNESICELWVDNIGVE